MGAGQTRPHTHTRTAVCACWRVDGWVGGWLRLRGCDRPLPSHPARPGGSAATVLAGRAGSVGPDGPLMPSKPTPRPAGPTRPDPTDPARPVRGGNDDKYRPAAPQGPGPTPERAGGSKSLNHVRRRGPECIVGAVWCVCVYMCVWAGGWVCGRVGEAHPKSLNHALRRARANARTSLLMQSNGRTSI